jgi:hypothetical protein
MSIFVSEWRVEARSQVLGQEKKKWSYRYRRRRRTGKNRKKKRYRRNVATTTDALRVP